MRAYGYDNRDKLDRRVASTRGAGSGWPTPVSPYNVDRWYEHGTGRYTRPDPERVFAPQRQIAYAYAGLNPLRFIDPLGLRIGSVDPSLEGELACLTKSKSFFRPYLHWLINDDREWNINTWQDAPGSTGCKRHNSPSCWTPGNFYVKLDLGDCASVKGLIHEIVEAHAAGVGGLSTFDIPNVDDGGAHDFANAQDDQFFPECCPCQEP